VNVEHRFGGCRARVLGFLALLEAVALDAGSVQWLLKSVRRGFGLVAGCDGRLYASCEGVDESGELGDGFECPVSPQPAT
jgi:hypothetical protein